MAPMHLRPRQGLAKERFSTYFAPYKSQPYHDPGSTRGTVNHGVRAISWNPLGNLIATGSTDKTLRVWNPEKPNVRFSTELKGHNAPIEKVAFNPVKDAELCSVSGDGVVKFWDVRTKACVNEVKDLGATFSLAWHPDGDRLLVGNKDDKIFTLSPTSSTPLASHQQPVQTNHIAFSNRGGNVFAPISDGRTRVLSYPDLEPVLEKPYAVKEGESSEYWLKGHTSTCISAQMSPSGQYLATGGGDAVICLWNTENWICKRTATSMVGPVRTISFTWDGAFVVGGSDEGTGLEVTHVESGEHVHSFKTAAPCPVVAWAPLRYWLAYSDLGILRIVGMPDTDRK